MQEMSALEVSEYLQQTETKPFLLDVREPWEFDICRIEGAKLIPMRTVPGNIEQLDPQQETIVICHHGIRSRMVGKFLEQADFINIINLSGGMAQWYQQVDSSIATY